MTTEFIDLIQKCVGGKYRDELTTEEWATIEAETPSPTGCFGIVLCKRDYAYPSAHGIGKLLKSHEQGH